MTRGSTRAVHGWAWLLVAGMFLAACGGSAEPASALQLTQRLAENSVPCEDIDVEDHSGSIRTFETTTFEYATPANTSMECNTASGSYGIILWSSQDDRDTALIAQCVAFPDSSLELVIGPTWAAFVEGGGLVKAADLANALDGEALSLSQWCGDESDRVAAIAAEVAASRESEKAAAKAAALELKEKADAEKATADERAAAAEQAEIDRRAEDVAACDVGVIAESPTAQELAQLAECDDPRVQSAVAKARDVDDDTLKALAASPYPEVRAAVLQQRFRLGQEDVRAFLSDSDPAVLVNVVWALDDSKENADAFRQLSQRLFPKVQNALIKALYYCAEDTGCPIRPAARQVVRNACSVRHAPDSVTKAQCQKY